MRYSPTTPTRFVLTSANFDNAAAILTNTPIAELSALSSALLLHPPTFQCEPIGQSDLSIGGAPIQLLMSARKARWQSRLISDPAFFIGDPLERFARSYSAIEGLLNDRRAPELQLMVEKTIEAIVPADSETRLQYPTGMLRFAARVGEDGAAIYCGRPPGLEPGWQFARQCADAVLGRANASTAKMMFDNLPSAYRFFGAGVEGINRQNSRLKFYWRMVDPSPLAAMGIDLFLTTEMTSFLKCCLQDRDFPCRALNFSAAFSVTDGTLCDVKIDVCCHSIGLSPEYGLPLIDALARQQSLSPPPLADCQTVLRDNLTTLGAIGLGVDRRHGCRLNIYFHPLSNTFGANFVD